MVKAVCSGSFDPVTYGHIDIFERASRMFDEVTVCVFHNIRKKSFFAVEERVRLIEEATGHLSNIRVISFEGLLPDLLHEQGATVNVRGLRNVTDFEYEQQQSLMLKHIAPDIETIFLMTDPRYSFLSSSAIREMVVFDADITELVPPCVKAAVERKLAEQRG